MASTLISIIKWKMMAWFYKCMDTELAVYFRRTFWLFMGGKNQNKKLCQKDIYTGMLKVGAYSLARETLLNIIQ